MGVQPPRPLVSGLLTLRAAENDAYATARAGALDSLWTIVGVVAVLWVAGLMLLVRRPSVVVRAELPAVAPGHTLLARADVAPAPARANMSICKQQPTSARRSDS